MLPKIMLATEGKALASSFNEQNKAALFKNLRATVAEAAGIEALANHAIESKDKIESLEHISELSGSLKEKLNRLSALITELDTHQ